MVHIYLYLYNRHQASASYPFSSIDHGVNVGAEADARCGQGLNPPLSGNGSGGPLWQPNTSDIKICLLEV